MDMAASKPQTSIKDGTSPGISTGKVLLCLLTISAAVVAVYVSVKRKTTKVAFSSAVVTPNDLTNLKPGQTVIFDKVITNIGEAYSRDSGVFIAPIDGIYVFNMDLMVRPGERQYVEFVKDGTHVMWNYGHAVGSKHYMSSSRTVTLQLDEGEKVWVRTQNSSDHGDGVIHGMGFTTFSGWLVSPL